MILVRHMLSAATIFAQIIKRRQLANTPLVLFGLQWRAYSWLQHFFAWQGSLPRGAPPRGAKKRTLGRLAGDRSLVARRVPGIEVVLLTTRVRDASRTNTTNE